MGKLSTLVVDLQMQSAQLRQEMKAVHQKLDEFGKSSLKVGDLLKGAFSYELIRRGAQALTGFLKDGLTGFLEDERGAKKLSAALTQLGYDAGALTPILASQADELEKLTLVDANQIRNIEQLLVQYGAAPSTVEKATRAILDYSTATKQDAVTATRSLLQAVVKGKDEIGRLGIKYEATGKFTEDLVGATTELEKMFGGTAAAATEGMSGAVGKLDLAMVNLSKAMAGFLAQTGAADGILGKLTEGIQGMTYALSNEHKEQKAAEDRRERLNRALEDEVRLRERIKALTASADKLGNLPMGEQWRKATYTNQIADLEKQLASAKARESAVRAEIESANKQHTAEAARTAGAMAAADATARTKAAQKSAEAAADAEQKALEKRLKSYVSKPFGADAQGNEMWKAQAELNQRMSAFLGGTSLAAAPQAKTKTFELSLPAEFVALNKGFVDRLQAAYREAGGDINATIVVKTKAFAAYFSDAFAVAGKVITSVSERIGQSLFEASGTFGSIIKATIEGAASGGVAGALVAGIGTMLEASEQFRKLTGVLDTIGQIAADTIGQVIGPFVEPLKALAPMVAMVGQIVLPLVPVLELFGGAIQWAGEVLSRVTQFLLGGVFELLRGIAETAVRFVRWLAELWNGIARFLGLNGLLIDMTGLNNAYNDLHDMTWEQARAAAEQTAATRLATGALNQFTEEVLGAPAGFKGLAGYAFAAANPDIGAPGGAGPTGGMGTGGIGGQPGGASGGEASTTQVYVSADLRRYVTIEGRTSGYAGVGSGSAPFVEVLAMDEEG